MISALSRFLVTVKEIINKLKMDKIIILITHDEDIKNMADAIIDLNIALDKELIIENN